MSSNENVVDDQKTSRNFLKFLLLGVVIAVVVSCSLITMNVCECDEKCSNKQSLIIYEKIMYTLSLIIGSILVYDVFSEKTLISRKTVTKIAAGLGVILVLLNVVIWDKVRVNQSCVKIKNSCYIGMVAALACAAIVGLGIFSDKKDEKIKKKSEEDRQAGAEEARAGTKETLQTGAK